MSPGFDHLSPPTQHLLQEKLADSVVDRNFKDPETRVEVSGRRIAKMFRNFSKTFRTPDPRIHGQTLKGSTEYIAALEKNALTEALERVFGEVPESPEERKELRKQATPDDFRNVVAAYFWAASHTEDPVEITVPSIHQEGFKLPETKNLESDDTEPAQANVFEVFGNEERQKLARQVAELGAQARLSIFHEATVGEESRESAMDTFLQEMEKLRPLTPEEHKVMQAEIKSRFESLKAKHAESQDIINTLGPLIDEAINKEEE